MNVVRPDSTTQPTIVPISDEHDTFDNERQSAMPENELSDKQEYQEVAATSPAGMADNKDDRNEAGASIAELADEQCARGKKRRNNEDDSASTKNKKIARPLIFLRSDEPEKPYPQRISMDKVNKTSKKNARAQLKGTLGFRLLRKRLLLWSRKR